MPCNVPRIGNRAIRVAKVHREGGDLSVPCATERYRSSAQHRKAPRLILTLCNVFILVVGVWPAVTVRAQQDYDRVVDSLVEVGGSAQSHVIRLHPDGNGGKDKGGETLDLSDLSAFRPAAGNWSNAGGVRADPETRHGLEPVEGEGVLVNRPTPAARGNLLSLAEHGDADLALQFMMARDSNSGIYLQGRYEVQLLDSWGETRPRYSDCGGIYQRRRADGSQFEGAAPRMNACKAPGLWQDLRISFQAPRFGDDGRKRSNAKILSVEINGATVHENLELSGPTGGAIGDEEVAVAPLMIQGDHGPLALRKIRLHAIDADPPTTSPTPTVPPVGSILVHADTPTVLRSFADIDPGNGETRRVTHAINVGSPQKLHYMLDYRQGAMVRAWRGAFLDATPMWHQRGDGNSTLGGAEVFLTMRPLLARLDDPDQPWPGPYGSSAFRPESYRIDASGLPVFHYRFHGVRIEDSPRIVEGRRIERRLTLSESVPGLHVLLAEAGEFELVKPGLYAVGDRRYYVRVGDSGQTFVREAEESPQLLATPGNDNTLSYAILF